MRRRYFIVWPAYFDYTKTRGEGRRVPKALSIRNPTIKDIAKALDLLGIKYIVEPDKSYPKEWWVKGRLLVDIEDAKRLGYTKGKLLRAIGKKLVEDIRGGR